LLGFPGTFRLNATVPPALHKHGAGILGGSKGYGVRAADKGSVAIRVDDYLPGIVRNRPNAGNHHVKNESSSRLCARG
jgi:hypothetical protein